MLHSLGVGYSSAPSVVVGPRGLGIWRKFAPCPSLPRYPGTTAPIIGPRTLEQLEGAIRPLEITLSEETLGKLDDIFPGPGGPAPEVFAW